MRTDGVGTFGNWAQGVPTEAITVPDGSDFDVPDLCRQIVVETPGILMVTQHDGNTGRLPLLAAGVPYTFSAKTILLTHADTTASAITLLR